MAHLFHSRVFLFACTLAIPAIGQPPPAPPTETQVLNVQGGKIRVIPVATGLVHPWSLALLPDGQSLLVTEKSGRLRLIHDGMVDPKPVWTSPLTSEPQAPGGDGGALHFIALHPNFAQNKLVYVSYAIHGDRGFTVAVAHGRLEDGTLKDVKEIFVADAWETGGNTGGRLFFGPDGFLYVTVGDRDRLCCTGTEDNHLRMKAQSLDTDVGKVLRLRDDGTPAPGNPFIGKAGAKPEIFSYGHRNGYGFAINPETGALWQTEIGPMGGDEVNILEAGHNYGWPLVSMGRNYTGSLVSDQPWSRPGMDNPRIFWVPSVSPSSMIFYTGDKFPLWKNNLLVGTLNGLHLERIAFHQAGQAEPREQLLAPLRQRIRDVIQSPDGYLYVATERTSGGNKADGTVLRIEPEPVKK